MTTHICKILTEAEAAFIDAAMARLIPADALGPGAKEAGLTCFIDEQLASAWGVHGRQYRMGPWHPGTPEQGYQLRFTPQELYREAIREINAHCVRESGRVFAHLPADVQDALLQALDEGSIALPSLPSNVFFAMLWRHTQEGFFADPIHGGNQDKIGWRLIGFPGVAAGNYSELMHAENRGYDVEPGGIADIHSGRAKRDAQGFPVHVVHVVRAGPGTRHDESPATDLPDLT